LPRGRERGTTRLRRAGAARRPRPRATPRVRRARVPGADARPRRGGTAHGGALRCRAGGAGGARVRSALLRWLDASGLLSAARFARHRLDPDSEDMRFPSYERDVVKMVRRSGDPARYASLALAIRTLQHEQAAGSFAEVGVYRGATSRFLMRCAPE